MRLISSRWVWQQVWLASQGLNAPGLVLHIHKNTNTHIHTNKCTERKRRDRRQAANNRTKTKQKWLVDEDWRTVTDTVLKHTPTCQGVEILQMYWGFSSFISIFVTREKKERKDVTPHTVYTEVNTRCQEKGGYWKQQMFGEVINTSSKLW